MMKRVAILAIALLLSVGCATYQDTGRERLQALPQHYSQFDLVMG